MDLRLDVTLVYAGHLVALVTTQETVETCWNCSWSCRHTWL